MVKTEKSAAVINRKEYATAYSRGVITAGGRHHKKQQGCGICRIRTCDLMSVKHAL